MPAVRTHRSLENAVSLTQRCKAETKAQALLSSKGMGGPANSQESRAQERMHELTACAASVDR